MEQPLRDDFWDAFDVWRGAIQDGIDPEERDNKLREVGKFLFHVGIGIVGASLKTAIRYEPPNNRTIFSDVIPRCFLFFAGSAGMIVGWFLMCCNNPGRYLYLANRTILALACGVVLALLFD